MASSARSLLTRLSLSSRPSPSAAMTPRRSISTKNLSTQLSTHRAALPTTNKTTAMPISPSRPFSASASAAAKGKGKTKGKPPRRDPRIRNIRVSMPRSVRHAAPLRFARNRWLRHWTIHRAWQLWRRKQAEEHERGLMRLQQSMSNACEELRRTYGPGPKALGYLYRVAIGKQGLYQHGAIPLEATRPQTETPARVPWNHDWKRDEVEE